MSSTCDFNLTCDIVCDLYPLYKDGFASSDSKEAIERHLKSCLKCRETYKKTTIVSIKNKAKEKEAPPKKIGEYSALAAMISKRKRKENLIINSALYGVVGISLTLTLIGLLKTYRD